MPEVLTSRRTRLGLIAVASLAAVTGLVPFAATADPAGDLLPRPSAAPVVLTGAQLPGWSQPAAQPVVGEASPVAGVRDAHAGRTIDPPALPTAAQPDRIAAFRWTDRGWEEVPVQVDERFPYFLRNDHSDFGIYSQTDVELTYAWDEERWNWTAGVCTAEPSAPAMTDPVATLDDDDEVVFMPDDAGARAPLDARGPVGTDSTRQEVAVVDPLRPGAVSYVYLFQRAGGSSYDHTSGYVRYERNADADEFIDRHSFADDDPEKLGSSNTGYGPNEAGPVCDPGGLIRDSTDRFPRDGVVVSTDAYRWTATGRWMVRGMQVAKPGQPGAYGPDLVDRWKGRAFQQSPDSSISVVGFEDEQVNWEANSALLGERRGPVRAIREVWGADSGTNVTKTETFYRDAITYRYRLRVHPIPPDGLYTSWDYNAHVAAKYFTPTKPDGVDIDGLNDDIGNVDSVGGRPAFFDAPDPALNVPLSLLTWEQVSGAGDAGSLVYLFENKGPTSVTEPTVVPYYRDDKCLDDGTGDNPVPRPWPGEASTDTRVRDGYVAAAGGTPYDQVTCDQKQGAWGSHGVHFFVTGDTDNAFLPSPAPVNEVDAQQWQFAVPTAAPRNVGDAYSLEVRAPRVATATPQLSTPKSQTALEVAAPATAQATDTFDAVITLTGGAQGARVRVTYDGVERGVTTDESGRAVVAFASGAVGARTITAAFDGDDAHAPSADSDSVEVVRERTSLAVTLGTARSVSTITARLTEDDPAPVPGASVTFLLNGKAVATRTTDAGGSASYVTRLRRGDVVDVVYSGDELRNGASASFTNSPS